MKKCMMFFVSCLYLTAICSGTASAYLETPHELPAKGMVTMVDLGTPSCPPCIQMAPIIKELQNEYEGRASIVFIDIWEYQDQAKKYGVRSMPTQIFYNKQGKEVFRHSGYMDKESIVSMLEKLGVKKN